MASISSKELSAIEDQLNYEQLLIKKYKTTASQCSDKTLSAKFLSIADKHQQHFNTLLNYLN